MGNAAKVLNWNGKDLPPELEALPPGQYVIEPAETPEGLELSDGQVEGLREASRSLDAGRGHPWGEVRDRLRGRIAREGR